MALVRGIHAELIKMKHTSLLWIHLIFPLLGAAVFLVYHTIYEQVDGMSKSVFVMQISAIVFPILIGTICGIAATNEERAGAFQTMLGSQGSRAKAYLSKLIALVLLGSVATALLVGLYVLGAARLSQAGDVSITIVIQLAAGLFAGNIVLYVICLFSSMKWGLGPSAFVGVVGSLLAVMFSNFDAAIVYFIPLMWGINFLEGLVLSHTHNASATAAFFPNIQSGAFIIVFFTLSIIGSLLWFTRWEGRKNNE